MSLCFLYNSVGRGPAGDAWEVVGSIPTRESIINLVISRGTVPAGYRIRSKVHKTAISIQPLSYTEIARGS